MFFKKRKPSEKEVAFDETISEHQSALSELKVKIDHLAVVVDERKKIKEQMEREFEDSIRDMEFK